MHGKYEDYINSIKEDLILPPKSKSVEGERLYLLSSANEVLPSFEGEQWETVVSEYCASCILPRVVLEQNEALFCSRFTLMFLKLSALTLNDMLRSIKFVVMKVLPFIQSATEKEAINVAIFVNDLLKPFSNYLDGADKLQESLKSNFHSQVVPDKYPYEKYSVSRERGRCDG